jgi:hypothetical protein
MYILGGALAQYCNTEYILLPIVKHAAAGLCRLCTNNPCFLGWDWYVLENLLFIWPLEAELTRLVYNNPNLSQPFNPAKRHDALLLLVNPLRQPALDSEPSYLTMVL